MDNELVIVRSIIVLIILFILTKWMGKKQISQMNLYDYIIGITIGSIAADISLDIEKDFLSGIISLIIYGGSGIIVTLLCLKFFKLRQFLQGSPTILIEEGKIIAKNLLKEGISLDDLEEEARQNGYFNLDKVNYAVLETSGRMSFLAKPQDEVVTKGDMKIKTSDDGTCINIIFDGKILEKNLSIINKDESWVMKELKKQGISDYTNILLMTIDKKGKLNFYHKNNKN